MNQMLITTLYAVALSASGVPSALAESVAVEGGSIFILDNSVPGSQIVVKNLANGAVNSCLASTGVNLLGLNADTSATDIVIKKGTAVIATYNTVHSVTDVMLVNVTNCPINYTADLSACYASVHDGKLTIPCLSYGGDVISVVLGQRGSSMNYEFESSGKGHDHEHD